MGARRDGWKFAEVRCGERADTGTGQMDDRCE